jgi:hypothetical protein
MKRNNTKMAPALDPKKIEFLSIPAPKTFFQQHFLNSQCACNPYGPRGKRDGNYLLVLTSFSFILPIFILYKNNITLPLFGINTCLLLSSLAYHSTHHSYIRAVDVSLVLLSGITALITFTLLLLKNGLTHMNIYLWLALICNLVSMSISFCPCFYGKYDPNDSDDPRKMIRLLPHAFLHLITAAWFSFLGLAAIATA